MTDNPQYDREDCYFCHEQDTHLLETHHLVPRRHGGSDDVKNLVVVCPTCHERLERLYDDRFYQSLGIDTNDSTTGGAGEKVDIVDGTGTKTQADRCKVIESIIKEIGAGFADGAPVEVVIERAKENDISPSKTKAEIEQLKQRGEVYEPRADCLRTT